MKRLMAICLALVLLIGVMPMPQADAATNMTATVKGGWLNLRESPSTSAKSLGSYYTGTKVTILGSSGNWYYVKVGNKTGYMLGSYLNVNADSGSTNAPAGNLNITAWVTSENGLGVRLRSGPSTAYSVIASYAVGTKVTILAKGTYWFQISVNGKIGYMMSQHLTTTQPGSSGNSGSSGGSVSGVGTAYVYAKNGGNVNLRAGAGKNFGVIGSYSVGTQVTVLTYGKTWSYIRVGTRTGYMMTDYLSNTAPSGGTVTPPASGSYIAYVTSANGLGVNLRTGAGKSYRAIASLPVGTQVTVLQHNTTWDYIRYGTTDGYMQNIYLTTTPPSNTTPPSTGSYYATVFTSANTYPVKMRAGAGTSFGVLASVPQGTKVLVLSVSNGWAYINYNGITGYMMSSFLVTDPVATDTPTTQPTDTPTTQPTDTPTTEPDPASPTDI